MGLGYSTIHTAIVYLHRFYMFHSFKTFPRYVTACSCLFLAGKVASIMLLDVVNTIYFDAMNISFAGRDTKKV
jgi:Cyclin, N-terminal domain